MFEGFGEVGVGGGAGPCGGEDAEVVGRGGEGFLGGDVEQEVIADAGAFAAPGAAAVVAAEFFFFDEEDFDGEVGVDGEVGEADEFVEEVVEAAALGGLAAGEGRGAVGADLGDPFFEGDGVDDAHRVIGEEGFEFFPHAEEAAGLDFDDFGGAADIDPVAGDFFFDAVAGAGVVVLELGVEGAFGQGADAGKGGGGRRGGGGGERGWEWSRGCGRAGGGAAGGGGFAAGRRHPV